MDLKRFDLIVLNSSGGKDSIAMIYEVCRMADAQGFPRSNIVVSHQCLGKMEWGGVTELVYEQAKMFGLPVTLSKRTANNSETLLEYAERRGKWPGSDTRWCTSDFKRAPGDKALIAARNEKGAKMVLNCYGFRAQESPARSKKNPYKMNKRLTFKNRKVKVYDWLPIHKWDTAKVWKTIKGIKVLKIFAPRYLVKI